MDGFTEHDKRVIRYVLHSVLYFICLKVLGAGWWASIAVSFTVLACLVSNINRESIERVITPLFWIALCVFVSILPEPAEWKADIISLMNSPVAHAAP